MFDFVSQTFQTIPQTMESHVQSVEDNLIDSLSFKLKPGASYVTDRRSVSFFPQFYFSSVSLPPQLQFLFSFIMYSVSFVPQSHSRHSFGPVYQSWLYLVNLSLMTPKSIGIAAVA